MTTQPFHIVLWEPEIPPNAGNVARLCAATNSILHFVGRLGFKLDEKSIKRAGLDYWPYVKYFRHENWDDFFAHIQKELSQINFWLVDNPAEKSYYDVRFQPGDVLVFGSESHGLPVAIKERYREMLISIPMANENVRSLNLATSVGIVLYEAIRQTAKN